MSDPLHIQLIQKRLVRIGAIPKPKTIPIQLSSYQRYQTLALYRSMLKETRKIKYDRHLHEWFSNWIRSSFKKNRVVTSEDSLQTKLRRANRELRCLRSLNEGSASDLHRALRYAYGRVGPLRHEILQHIMAQPSPPTPPLIKGNPRSAPPRYPPILAHLLTNHHHTTDQPVRPKRLESPPSLSPRADPTSEDAHLYGPLSKRRENNIRWRYYGELVNQVHVPLGSIGGPYQVVGIAPDAIERLERLAMGTGDDGSKLGRSVRRAYSRILGATPITRYHHGATDTDGHDAGVLSTEKENASNDENKTQVGRRDYASRLSPLAVQPNTRGGLVRSSHSLPSWAERWLQKASVMETKETRRTAEVEPLRKLRRKMLIAMWAALSECRALDDCIVGL
ncbi:hypothetical protein CALVIDRAFT_540667 [Calocera viscosa TUFC12733]|uniref:LYR motif-containing protein Cup1-like N-terminal domain-containing protein n=1 Tax=Calocera viscosa (strain TUFC12733) TaxID=1330018 RepID=A0A167IMC7_CALVF|nr:hypothetical protein CALVIDRAFT_540667 [Calocera viscosa TUFC12733]